MSRLSLTNEQKFTLYLASMKLVGATTNYTRTDHVLSQTKDVYDRHLRAITEKLNESTEQER